MKTFNSITLIALFFATSCATIRVVTDQLDTADFTQYSTFRIMEPKTVGAEKIYFNQLNRNRVKNAIREQMKLRNYSEVQEADLGVHIYVKTETKMDVVSTTGALYPRYRYWGYQETGLRSYREGTLIIDLVDEAKKELVWHGVAVSTIDGPYKEMDERIRKVVTAIFDEYPYMAGSNIVKPVVSDEIY